MAMNKAEKAVLDLALTVASFYRTQPVPRDLLPPTSDMDRMDGSNAILPPGYGRVRDVNAYGGRHNIGQLVSMGWDFNSYQSPRVEKACSSSIGHDFGNWKGTTTQQPRALFSTKLLALRAMRHEIEMEACRKLRAVDKMIEAEIANPTPGPEASS